MKNKKYILVFMVAVAFLFSTCKSSKKAESSHPSEQVKVEFKTFSAKGDISLSRNEAQSIKVGANLRIRRDSIIIISIQPLSGVEVGRITCDREGIILLDRINKRYFSLNFTEIKEKMNAEFSYEALQGILVGEVFAFGKEGKANITDFNRSEIGNMIMLQRSFDKITQEYILNDSLEIQSGILQEESYRIRWSYTQPHKSDIGTTIPLKTELTLHAGAHLLGKLGFDYKRVELNKEMNFSSNIPANYSKVSYSELLKLIAN